MLISRLRARLARLGSPAAGPAPSSLALSSATAAPDPHDSRAAITRFLFIEDEPQPVDFCFVLGCPTPTNMDPAIALFHGGFTQRLVIAGQGPTQQAVPEAVQFRDYAVARGVPAAACLLETESTNTRENFAFAAPLIEAQLGWARVRSVAIVSKPFHARRALMTAQRHWPAHLRYVMRPSQHVDDSPADRWWQDEAGRGWVLREFAAIGTYAQQDHIGGF